MKRFTMNTQRISLNNLVNTVCRRLSLVMLFIAFFGANTHIHAAWPGSGQAVSGSGTTWYVVNQSSYETLNTIETGPEINLSGPGASVSYEAKGSSSLTGAGVKYFQYSYYDGSWHNSSSQTLTTSYKSYSYNIGSNVTKIRFQTVTGSTYTKNVQNIKVTMAQYIENPSATSLAFGSSKVDDAATVKTFTIAWCNVPAMTYELTGTGSDKVSVSITNNAAYGKYNTATITVTYKHGAASTLNATLTIKDTYGGYSRSISLTGSTTKYDQTITWSNKDDIPVNLMVGATPSITASTTSSLPIKYTSSNSSALSVDAGGNMSALAVGTATITLSQAGNYKYNAATDVTKTFTVKTKDTPIFTPNGFTTATKPLKVGDKVTLDVAYVSSGLTGDFRPTYDSHYFNVTRSGSTVTIEAKNAGLGKTVQFTQTENTTIFGANVTYTFDITKIDNTLAVGSTAYDIYVDEQSPAVRNGQNSDGAITTTTSDATLAYYDIESNKIVAQNTGNQSFDTKNVTITINQAATYKYTASAHTITVTVKKHVPVFTWRSGDVYFDNTYTDYLVSTGTNTFSVSSSSDADVAYLTDGTTSTRLTLKTRYKYASTTLTVKQSENYYWAEHTETKTITPVFTSNHVPFTFTEAMFNTGSIKVRTEGDTSWDEGIKLGNVLSGFNWDDKYVDIRFEGVPAQLSFTFSNSDLASELDQKVYQSANGTNWEEIWSDGSSHADGINITKDLKPSTRYLRFFYSGNYAGYYKNIRITQRKELQTVRSASDWTKITTIDFGENEITVPAADQTYYLFYASAGHNVILTTDDPAFTVVPSSLTTIGGDQYGTTPVKVSYSTASQHNNQNAKLTITDENGTGSTVTLKGRTNKKTPTVTWSSDAVSFNAGDILTASSAEGTTVTLSAAGYEQYVSCEGNTATMIQACATDVVITANVAENATFAAAQATKTIRVTNKTKQTITWEQALNRLKTTDAVKSVTLNATASSGLPVSYTLAGDQTGLTLTQSGNTWTLTYSATPCSNTTIIATQAGNTEYAEATPVSLPVKVIDPTALCGTSETLINQAFNLKGDITYSLNIPQQITLRFRKIDKTYLGIHVVYTGNFIVKLYNKNGTEIYSRTVSQGDVSYSSDYTLTINTSSFANLIEATSIKLVSEADQWGYDVKSLSYTQQQYCSTNKSELSFTGSANAETPAQTFTVSYCNYPLEVESTNPKFHLTNTSFGDCGEYGTAIVSVVYSPGDFSGEESGTIQIKDNTGAVRASVNVTGVSAKVGQSVTSHNVTTSYLTTDQVTLTAETSSGLNNFTFTASPADVAVFNGNVMTFVKACDNLSITISEPGSNGYNPCSTTIEGIKVTKVTPDLVAPSGSDIHYLDNLSESTISGGSASATLHGVEDTNVPGTFAWTTTHVISDNQGTHSYLATFTPDNTNLYNTATCYVTINILRATTPDIALNNATIILSDVANNRMTTQTLTDLVSTLPEYNPMARETFTFSVKAVDKTGYLYSSATIETGVVDNGNHTFYATEAGVYTLTATSPQTDYYESRSIDFTVTVNKRPNFISVHNETSTEAGDVAYTTSIYTDATENNVTVSATNTDEVSAPITVSQTAGAEIVAFDREQATVASNSLLGEARWLVSQPENAYYLATNTYFVVNVIRKPSASCNLYYDSNEYEVTNGITDFQGQVGHVYSIGEGQYAEAVYITAKLSFAGIANFYLQYSTDNGNNYTDLSGNLDLSTSYKTFGPYYFPANTIVTNVRTITKTGGTLNKHYKDLCVTRKVVLSAEPVHITTTAASLPVYVNQQGVGTLMVEWSCSDGGDLKLVSNNSKFTLSQEVIENTECANGKTPITVYYTSSTAGTDNATITIYNESQNIQVAVTGVTHKTPQTIDYLVNDEVVMPTEQGYIPVHVGDVITARTNRGHLVLFQSTSDAEVMSISDNQRTLTPVANGTVTVQAHGLNTDEEAAFATVDETMRFVVTQDIIQTIVWDQTFLSLVYGEDETIDLTGYATYTDSQGRNKTRAVVYTVADESVASVEGNVLTITGAGQTTIAASVSGGEIDGETFLAASKTLKIVARDPNAPCDTYIYTQSGEEKRDLGWNWTQADKTATVVYDLQAYGEPRTCNFDYWGTSQKDLAGVSYFAPGIVKVEEYYDGTWHTVQDNLSPTKENQWQNSGDILLSDKATKVQVVVYGPLKGKIAFVEVDKWPTGYFFVNNMVITKARYMRPSVDTLRLGEQLIFAPYTIQEPVNIRYSNIYGPISIASDNPKFVVSQRTIAGECGDHGSYPLLITYTPTTEQIPDTAHIRISDGRLDTTIVVTGMGRAIPTYTFTGEAGTDDKGTTANWDEEGIPAVRDWRVVVEKDMRLSEGQSLESNIFVIKQGATVTVGDGATLTIGGGFPSDAVQGNIVVEAGGTLNFTDVKTYGKANIQNLTLCSSLGNRDGSGKSGQIHHIEQLDLRGDAYFEVALDASGACSPGWYDFTVPFEAERGSVTRRDNTTHEIKTIAGGVNYKIMDYDEGRSLNGYGWHVYSGNLKPGRIYTITIDDVDNVYRFKKAKRATLNDASRVAMICSEGDEQKRGWNGLGNGTFAYSTVAADTEDEANRIRYIQIYDHASNTYTPVAIDEYTFVVGSAFLVQTPVAQDMLFTEPAVSGMLQAPGRNRDEQAEAFTIEMTDTEGVSVVDRLFVSASNTALDTYQIGHDLVKLSKGEAGIAQMWAAAYDNKLCAVELPLQESSVRVPLGFYAPAQGAYLLDVTKAPADAALYLTYDGKAIWNLSAAPYTLYLNKGENTHYGLMYIQDMRPIPTGWEQTENDGEVQKFVQNGVLYIYQNGVIYDATGKKVKNINE